MNYWDFLYSIPCLYIALIPPKQASLDGKHVYSVK